MFKKTIDSLAGACSTIEALMQADPGRELEDVGVWGNMCG
jgi:hypothetical protein